VGAASASPLKAPAIAARPSRPTSRGGRTTIPVADVTAAFSSVFIALSIALAVTYLAAPELRRWLGGRRGLVDWITFGALVAALAVGVWAMRRSPTESRFPLIIPALAAWGILDELRYLTGALGVHGFVIDGVQVRSLDDVGWLFSTWGERVGLTWLLGAVILGLVAGLTAIAVLRTRRWADNRVMVTEHRVVAYILASIGATVAAPLTGFFGSGAGVAFACGLVEMTGATLLVAAGLAAGDHRRTVAGWRRRLWPWLAEEGPLARLPLRDTPGPDYNDGRERDRRLRAP